MNSPGISACPLPPSASRIVEVLDAAGLTRALAAAQPDDWIHLAPGRYDGRFTASVNGTPSSPIVVCGSRSAVLDGGGIDIGYGFHLTGAHWILAGFTVTASQKGIVLDGARDDVLEDLEVFGIGDEGVHFRAFSSDNTLERSYIHDVGRLDADAGEGVYVGSASSHWGQFSGGHPDASDRNQIVANTIGPNTTAESVDVKEGTTGTVLEGNVFDGTGMTAADSWVDVKGNDAMIVGNIGHRTPLDGFQTHVVVPGWGADNRFSDNVADVAGPGLGFRIDVASSGNVVTCDNTERGAQAGLSNVSCTELKPSMSVSSLRSDPVATP
jgi:Right handed beta helix region